MQCIAQDSASRWRVMKRVLFLALCVPLLLFPIRDPFNPVTDEVECFSSLAIRGIITSEGVRACVISTGVGIATLHAGEQADGVTVVRIEDGKVIVKKDGELQTLVMK